MKNQRILSIVLILLMTHCSVKKEDSLLTDAALLHNEAVALASQLEEQLATLASDTTHLRDSVTAWRIALKNWQSNLVEVPGNEFPQHDHAHHAHKHEAAVDLTSEQMLTLQQEMKAQIEELKKRINSTTKNDESL